MREKSRDSPSPKPWRSRQAMSAPDSGQVEDYKLLAETIGYKAYFYNAEDKKGTFYWFANEKRYDTIVATSAFRTGIDIPYIR